MLKKFDATKHDFKEILKHPFSVLFAFASTEQKVYKKSILIISPQWHSTVYLYKMLPFLP